MAGPNRVQGGTARCAGSPSYAFGDTMKRTLFFLAVAGLALADTGCTTFCRKLFGLDRRCDTPPPCYTAPPPVYGAPGPPPAVGYGPPPPGACVTPR